MTPDRYATFDYSRLISWPARLQREWPFLDPLLAAAPSRRVLDLGSGTGEHARLISSKGYEVLGLDTSPAMVEKARSGGGTFVLGDMRELSALIGEERFGVALCLGNALPHLTGEDDLERLAGELRKVLLPGGPVVIQFLNYDRLERKKERALPLSFLPDPDDPAASLLFLRAIELRPDKRVVFMPTVLRVRPDQEPPMELLGTQRVEVRSWRADDLERAFRVAGFTSIEILGSYGREPFDAGESRDVIFVAK